MEVDAIVDERRLIDLLSQLEQVTLQHSGAVDSDM
jgi:hypothetical protein